MSYDRLCAGNESAHVHFDLQALHTPPSMLYVYSRMLQEANQSHAKAAQLRLGGADWDDALKEAAIPDTKLARKSVCGGPFAS